MREAVLKKDFYELAKRGIRAQQGYVKLTYFNFVENSRHFMLHNPLNKFSYAVVNQVQILQL
jgi:hypothetical protein